MPSADRVSLTFNLAGQWGVVIDAGSSGTRAFIYKWMDVSSARGGKGMEDLGHLPELTLAKVKKTHPGISTFASRPVDINHHLGPLIDAATKEIPASRIPDTPIFVLATAGMRLVPRLNAWHFCKKHARTCDKTPNSTFRIALAISESYQARLRGFTAGWRPTISWGGLTLRRTAMAESARTHMDSLTWVERPRRSYSRRMLQKLQSIGMI